MSIEDKTSEVPLHGHSTCNALKELNFNYIILYFETSINSHSYFQTTLAQRQPTSTQTQKEDHIKGMVQTGDTNVEVIRQVIS